MSNNLLSQISIPLRFASPFGRGRGIADFASVILSNAVAIAAVLLLVLLIYGGITYIVSAGNGNKEDLVKGQKIITTAIIGFLIVFASYWIIYLVQRLLGFNILQPTQPLP